VKRWFPGVYEDGDVLNSTGEATRKKGSNTLSQQGKGVGNGGQKDEKKNHRSDATKESRQQGLRTVEPNRDRKNGKRRGAGNSERKKNGEEHGDSQRTKGHGKRRGQKVTLPSGKVQKKNGQKNVNTGKLSQ